MQIPGKIPVQMIVVAYTANQSNSLSSFKSVEHDHAFRILVEWPQIFPAQERPPCYDEDQENVQQKQAQCDHDQKVAVTKPSEICGGPTIANFVFG